MRVTYHATWCRYGRRASPLISIQPEKLAIQMIQIFFDGWNDVCLHRTERYLAWRLGCQH